jgi:hypothetical protein
MNKRRKHKKGKALPLPDPVIGSPLFFRNRVYRAGAYAGATAAAFFRIDPAFSVFLGNSFHRTFAVTGTAVCAGIIYFISHDLPLLK